MSTDGFTILRLMPTMFAGIGSTEGLLMTDDDRLPAALTEIRERNEDRIRFYRYIEATVETDVAEGDVRRLLTAVDKALEFHRPYHLYGFLDNDPEDTPCSCGHDSEAGCHFEGDEGGEWLCRCKLERTV